MELLSAYSQREMRTRAAMGWIVSPQRMLKLQPFSTVNVILFGNRIFAGDQIKMRSLGRTPIQYDWCSYKRGNLDIETDMHRGKMIWWWGECLLEARENLRLPEVRREAWNSLFLTALRRNQPCQHLDFRLLASRTVRQ